MTQWIGWKKREFRGSMPAFRREFEVKPGLVRATARITGLGQYAWQINGVPADDSELEPAWTNYRKTVFFRTHEIADRLHEGVNRITVLLGNGMYNVEGGRYAKFTGSMGEPALRFELELAYASGETERIVSDTAWEVSAGPITFSCTYGGEDRDGTWTPHWEPAVPVRGPEGELKESTIPPMKVQRVFEAVPEPGLGENVFDTRQNMSGFFRLTMTGARGSRIRVRLYELADSGMLIQKFTGEPHYYEHVLSGEPEETWRPLFTYYGFRYIKVEVISGTCEIRRAEGLMVWPDVAPAGGIETSDQLLNRIHEIILNAVRSNMKSVFTDCPHREKLGWLEQLHLSGETLLSNLHCEAHLRKAVADMAEAQTENGMVPDIAPEFVVFEGGFRDSAAWGSSCIFVPWELHLHTGETEILRTAYPMMKRYTEYLGSRAGDGILHLGLGDWCDAGVHADFPQNTPVPPVETAIYYRVLTTMAQISALLGRDDDRAGFEAEAGRVKEAYNAAFYDPWMRRYSTGSQTSLTLPLLFGLVPEQDRAEVTEKLMQDLDLRENAITGGEIGFTYLMQLLDALGCHRRIFDMIHVTDKPGYGFMVKNGATTLCEAWDGNAPGAPRNSQNHFMMSAVEGWFHHGLAGFRNEREDDARSILIEPFIPDEMSWLRAWHDYPQGRAEIGWERQADGSLQVFVTVPDRAVLSLNGAREELPEAGTYHRTLSGNS